MVQLIVGNKGKGKTKEILDKVNEAVKTASGNIVYLDRNSKHMYELNNKIRLIDVSTYPIRNSDAFVGFVSGIISQDHDLEAMYLDGFLKIAKIEESDVSDTLKQLQVLSDAFSVDFVVSLSMDKNDVPQEFLDNIITAL